MKKKISIILSILIIFGSLSPTYANYNSTNRIQASDFSNLRFKSRPLDNSFNLSFIGDIDLVMSYDLELIHIIIALGSDFNHKWYVNKDTELNESIKKFFYRSKDLESVKLIYELCGEDLLHKDMYAYLPLLGVCQIQSNIIDFLDNPLPKQTDKIKTYRDLKFYLKQFFDESDAEHFFMKYHFFYDDILDKYFNHMNFDILAIIEPFFGYSVDEKFIFYVNTTKTGGHMSYHEDYYSSFYLITMDIDGSFEYVLDTIVHELVHAFLWEVLIDNYYRILNFSNSNSLYKGNLSQVYDKNNSFDIYNEVITRAITSLIILSYVDYQAGLNNIDKSLLNGWDKVGEIAIEILTNYDFLNNTSRRHQNFKRYFPDLINYVSKL